MLCTYHSAGKRQSCVRQRNLWVYSEHGVSSLGSCQALWDAAEDAFHKGLKSSNRVTTASEAMVITQKDSFKETQVKKQSQHCRKHIALPEAIRFLIKKNIWKYKHSNDNKISYPKMSIKRITIRKICTEWTAVYWLSITPNSGSLNPRQTCF